MTQELKNRLRQTLLSERDIIPPEQRALRSQTICNHLKSQQCYQQAQVIMGYWAIKSELDLSGIMADHLKRGGRLILPRINRQQQALDLYWVSNLEGQTLPGVWGIREPDPLHCLPALVADIDLVLIPGAGFDTKGNRLGYGAGFYDRLLAHPDFHGVVVACLFEEQLAPAIPAEPHDIPVDILITDRGVIKHV